MDAHLFLRDLALVLCVAAVTTVACQVVRLPVVVGYIIAGLLVGPHVPFPLFVDVSTLETLSELGVILLMFSVGLEFNMRKLLRLAPTAGFVAAIQIALMLVLGYLTGELLGWTRAESLTAGAMIAISSTMIIAQVFREQKVEGKVSDLVFGILIMEDLAAILLLAALATVGGGDAASTVSLTRQGGRLLLFMLGLFAVGLLIVPRSFRAIVALKRPETTVVASVGLAFALALIALKAGYSVALGSFLAGALVAESGVESRVEHLVHPIRDMFAAVFFVAVGALFDPGAARAEWVAVLVLTLVVIFGKLLGVAVGSFLAGYSIRTSVRAGMSMAQVGEFSFIIAGAYVAAGGSDRLYSIAIAVAVLTSFTTPWLIRLSERVALMVDARLPRPLQTFVTLYGSWIELLRQRRADSPWKPVFNWAGLLLADLALLCGVVISAALLRPTLQGWIGTTLGVEQLSARWLVVALGAAVGMPFLFGGVQVAGQLARQLAERALPRPATGKVDNALAPRRVLTSAIQLGVVLLTGLLVVAVTQPFVPSLGGPIAILGVIAVLGYAFWRSAKDLQGHMQAGAEVAVHALTSKSHKAEGTDRALQRVESLLPGIGTLSPLVVEPGSRVAGHTLAESNLRGLTGATIVAIVRGDEPIIYPSGHEHLYPGDILALSGSHEAIDAARALLAEPAATTPVPATYTTTPHSDTAATAPRAS